MIMKQITMYDILQEAIESVFGEDRIHTNGVQAAERCPEQVSRVHRVSHIEERMEHTGNNHSAQKTHPDDCIQIRSEQNPSDSRPCVEHLCEQMSSVDMSCENGLNQVDRPLGDNGFDVNVINKQDEDGDTLLHSAIITAHEEIAELFINFASSNEVLNLKNKLGQTPLHLAALTNQVSVLRRLIVGGADIMARDKNGGNTPLHIACREGHIEMVRALTEPVRYLETKKNRYDIPYQRIPQDLNTANYDGHTCMHLAAIHGHTDIVKYLINKHGDPNCGERKTGRSVLHIACLEGNVELVRLLLQDRSCDINARAYNGATPFDLARDRGHSRIMYELAASGAEYLNEIDMDEY